MSRKNYSQETETLKKPQKMQNTMNQIKKLHRNLETNRADVMGDRISNVEDRSIELYQVEEDRELRLLKKRRNSSRNIQFT